MATPDVSAEYAAALAAQDLATNEQEEERLHVEK